MASTADYLATVLDLLSATANITHRKMMGEYLLYSNGILFGGIYDDRFLVKTTPTARERFESEAIPYPGAKAMRVVDIEDPVELARIIAAICTEVKRR